jgi:hypothetical protein
MYKKLEDCKYCKFSFIGLSPSERANHSRWCTQNPKRSEYVTKNNGSQFQTPDVIKKRTEGIKKAHADGKYDHVVHTGNKGYKHTEATLQILREKALASPHRRLVRSIRDYVKKDGTVVKLDSAWEEVLAKRLDELDINWVRPGAIKWIDSKGVIRNYFPDFYLTEYDVYLDPKNPYAIKAQQEKISCLTLQLTNLIIITTLDDCRNFTIPAGQATFNS